MKTMYKSKEIEAIVESMMFVETKMQDKKLATRILNIYKDYLTKEYPNEDAYNLVKKYKRKLKRQLK